MNELELAEDYSFIYGCLILGYLVEVDVRSLLSKLRIACLKKGYLAIAELESAPELTYCSSHGYYRRPSRYYELVFLSSGWSILHCLKSQVGDVHYRHWLLVPGAQLKPVSGSRVPIVLDEVTVSES